MIRFSLFVYSLVLIVVRIEARNALPQVELGYEVHQAYSLNETAQTYSFNNIRYAQAPVGTLRFAAPIAPIGRDPVVQNGSLGRICPQAIPTWSIASGSLGSGPDPRTTEDCLFLDVVAPKIVVDNVAKFSRKRWRRQQKGLPVVVWIYGGGYVQGEKGSYANPNYMIQKSRANGGQGFIFVTMNYRLGAFGFLGGPTLQAGGGVPNAGLLDQRLAIEWVTKYIHLFGGDPGQITLMGQSAGGGSVEQHITAYGGSRPASFQKAILQSPATLPIVSQNVQENITLTFLSLLNVSTIAQARGLSSEALIGANALQVAASPHGSFTFAPMVDGSLIPALPGMLLNTGRFAKNVAVMAGHNLNEGAFLIPPHIASEADIVAFIRSNLLGIPQPVLDYMLTTLYPPIYDGSQNYTNAFGRVAKLAGELLLTCNTHYLAKAYANNTYDYEFQVGQAFHGDDVLYTFYLGQGTNPAAGLFADVAETLQDYIINFIHSGNPTVGPMTSVNGVGSLPPFSRSRLECEFECVECVWYHNHSRCNCESKV